MRFHLTAILVAFAAALAVSAVVVASGGAGDAPAFDEGYRVVKTESDYARRQLAKVGAAPEQDGYLISLSAMNYVQGHVRAAVYGSNTDVDRLPADTTAETILEHQAGICGAAALTFAAIVQQFGYPVRSVQFWYPNGDGHIADEVFYANSWHYFDPTWGVLYRQGGNTLSISAVRKLKHPDKVALVDETSFWGQMSQRFSLGKVNLEAGWHASARPDARVVLNGQPFAR